MRTPIVFNVVMPAEHAAIRTVVEAVVAAFRDCQGMTGHEFEIELALREALANAIRHGCHSDPTKTIRCRVTFGNGRDIRIVVRDPGSGFDVTAVPSPLESPNLLRPNGRGLFFIRQVMDEVHFSRGGREIRMCKRLEPGGKPSRVASDGRRSVRPGTGRHGPALVGADGADEEGA